MNHTIRVDRKHPACFVLLLDQSYSMSAPMQGGDGLTKAQALADTTNRLLTQLIQTCTRDEAGPRHYFDIALIGYADDAVPLLKSNDGFGNPMVASPQLAESYSRIHRGPGGEEWAVWLEPESNGQTAMCAALDRAYDFAAGWTASHQDSPAPVVINVTDGAATDGSLDDVAQRAAKLQQLSTVDGPLILFNIAIAARAATPVLFPSDASGLPDPYTAGLFRISSALPARMMEYVGTDAELAGLPRPDAGARGFVCNADLEAVVKALNVGTRVEPRVNGRRV
ncbi:vWA domain-containing protein [Streptomyces sp. NPDC001443]